jgi:hypothetical protein
VIFTSFRVIRTKPQLIGWKTTCHAIQSAVAALGLVMHRLVIVVVRIDKLAKKLEDFGVVVVLHREHLAGLRESFVYKTYFKDMK